MNHLADPQTPLAAADAVAAIILADDRYLMQLRESRPDIWYPGHWGLFGGALEAGEDPISALARELEEELELRFDRAEARFFMQLQFDLSGIGLARYRRDIYTVAIRPEIVPRLMLHEGADLRLFAGRDILAETRVTPYDAFAIFLHVARSRLLPPA